MNDEIRQEMGLSHREFHHSIQPLMADRPWRRTDDTYRIAWDGGWVELTPGPERQRRMASLVLPRTEVVVRFQGIDADERRRFMRRFEIAFQRGGG